MEKIPKLLEDKKYAELFKQCVEVAVAWNAYDDKQRRMVEKLADAFSEGFIDSDEFYSQKDELEDKYVSDSTDFITTSINSSEKAAKRAVEVLGDNPSFDTIDANLRAEIKYSDIELGDMDYEFLSKHMNKFAVVNDKMIVMQRGRSYVYPNLEVVENELKTKGFKKIENVQDADYVTYYHMDYERAMPAEVQALVHVIERFLGEALEKAGVQPGEQE